MTQQDPAPPKSRPATSASALRRGRSEKSPTRLGGALAVIFWCACGITALPIAGAFSLIASHGFSGMMWALSETFAGTTLQAQVLRLGLVPQLALFAWGAVFVALTIAKSRHALILAPWLMIAWVVVSAACQFAIRDLMAPDGASLGDFVALVPGLLLQAAGAAALYGYFQEGARPRAYYGR